MNSPHVSQQESKSHPKEETPVKKNAIQIYPVNCYIYLDYPYLFEFDLLRLMGVEMPPIRKGGYQPPRGGYWRDRHRNGVLPPPLMVLPFYHSPNMISNTQIKRNYWNHNDHQRDDRVNKDPALDGSNNSDSGFSSPVPCKHQIMGLTENLVLDDSSEDSFRSSASENGKCLNRMHGPIDARGNRASNSAYYYRNNRHRHEFPPCYHHRNHNLQNYGKRRHNSEFTPQNTSRGPGQTHNGHCRTSNSHGDLTTAGGNNRHYGRRMFLTGKQNCPHYIPPDRFLARADHMEVTNIPSQLNTTGEWGKLSFSIYNKFLENQQTSETFRKKITLWKNLFIFIRSNFPKFGLFVVGSTMSGFGSNDSDVDMCLLVRHTEMDQKNEAVSHLGHVAKCLRRCDFVDHVELIQAKVPILKFRSMGVEVDLNCNNAVGIRNTHLLYCYSQMDWRVRPLVLIVKLWAAKQDINDAKKMTISSYSLSLMVIHYLQCGVTPAVLPCLHEMYKDKFSPFSDINQIDLHEELSPYSSENTQSLGELLLGFLLYFGQFDYSTYAISVRLASKITKEDCRRAKSYKNEPYQWKYLCIEEPFDLTNTARSVYNFAAFNRIKRVFSKSHNKLKETGCLDSIFKKL